MVDYNQNANICQCHELLSISHTHTHTHTWKHPEVPLHLHGLHDMFLAIVLVPAVKNDTKMILNNIADTIDGTNLA